MLARAAGALVPTLLGVAYFAPLVIHSPFRIQTLTLAFLNGAVVASLVVSLGYAGLLNLSQGTFYGLGAYTTAILVTDHGWPFAAAALASMAVAGTAGVCLALATARVKDDYFVLVSLGLTVATAQLIANLPGLTRGREGFFGLPELGFIGLSFNNPVHSYYLCLGLLTVIYVFVYRITSGFLGRVMLTVRYDDVAARSMGIRPLIVRAIAMSISSGLAGFAGAFLVGTIQFLTPSDFDFASSFLISLYVIIGGMASLPGGVLVAIGFTLLNAEIRQLSQFSIGILGAAVLATVFWRAGVLRDAVSPIVRALRRRRNLDRD